MNVADNDGDTPLYTVESIRVARFLVEHGAVIDRRNKEGISVSLLVIDECMIDATEPRSKN